MENVMEISSGVDPSYLEAIMEIFSSLDSFIAWVKHFPPYANDKKEIIIIDLVLTSIFAMLGSFTGEAEEQGGAKEGWSVATAYCISKTFSSSLRSSPNIPPLFIKKRPLPRHYAPHPRTYHPQP